MDAHCIRGIYSSLTTHVLPIFPTPLRVSQGHIIGLVNVLRVAVTCVTCSLNNVRGGMNFHAVSSPALATLKVICSQWHSYENKWWGSLNHSSEEMPWRTTRLREDSVWTRNKLFCVEPLWYGSCLLLQHSPAQPWMQSAPRNAISRQKRQIRNTQPHR